MPGKQPYAGLNEINTQVNRHMVHRRTAIVTGAYGAIGKAISRGLAGRYFEQKKEVRCPFSRNRVEVEELFAICMKY